MASISNILDNKKFNEWFQENQEIFALISRQGGYEGLLLSILGSKMELLSDELKFIKEKHHFDLTLIGKENALICEFKHNFVHQHKNSLDEFKKNFKKAVQQVTRKHPAIKNATREVVYIITEIVEVKEYLPTWATKYKNNEQSKQSICLEEIKKFKQSCNYIEFELSRYTCLDAESKSVKTKIHIFVFTGIEKASTTE